MIYYVAKRGAVLSNGEVLYPGDIINNTFQSLERDESEYLVAKTLQDLKNRKMRKVYSTMKEFDVLYDAGILRNIDRLKPLSDPKFKEGSLVKAESGEIRLVGEENMTMRDLYGPIISML